MPFRIDLWSRYEFQGTPIYIRGDKPDWFVPNEAGDKILQKMAQNGWQGLDITAQRFLDRLPNEPVRPYRGRLDHLKVEELREIWFHITNRCNQVCSHCLFASSPTEKTELATGRILELAAQARRMGCCVYALTGGEPLFHPDFEAIVDHLLGYEAAHVVVLTNGTLLHSYRQALKRWPTDRFHLQLSVDGLGPVHDQMRGRGAFAALTTNLELLRQQQVPFTLAICVNATNVADLPELVDLAAARGAANLHFLWYFQRGRGVADKFVSPTAIFASLKQAFERAKARGLSIDNLETLKTQIFAPSGTKHDGAGSGWESLTVGPEGRLYPSPATVGVTALATDIHPDLATAWRQSPVLAKIRQTSAAQLESPWRFLLGGGDLDHSYVYAGNFLGQDPYLPLYEQLALWLISQELPPQTTSNGLPGLRLKMGDILVNCGVHGEVALTHSNCLLAAASSDSRTMVKEFYGAATVKTKENILNPVRYPESAVAHIPEQYRFRGYGCGSPVLDGRLQPGEHVLDLGCGTGVECFIAALLVGPEGRVIGVDMLEPMLDRAVQGAAGVAQNLGYHNLAFKQGYLEELPMPASSVDVVLSNCVINLSGHKRQTFTEIFRVLKPGGRLVISDVVCETEPDPAIKNDPVLQGECLAGALTQRDLFGLLEESGFVAARVLKRFPYRLVQGHQFFSLTYEARRPAAQETRQVMYRGPFAAVVTVRGELLPVGQTRQIALPEFMADFSELFILDKDGVVTNQEQSPNACCTCEAALDWGATTGREESVGFEQSPAAVYPASEPDRKLTLVKGNPAPDPGLAKQPLGCLVCGAPVIYPAQEVRRICAFCKREEPTQALCENGHFVCDTCHTRDATAFLNHICQVTPHTDMLWLLWELRQHPSIPQHGPEHHILVPGIILATYRNLGGQVPPTMLQTALRRGQSVPGGYCAFTGACGAALGVGIAFSLLLGASPVKAKERQQVQQLIQAVIQTQAQYAAGRCCQRDSWLALKKAAELSQTYLPLTLRADFLFRCQQAHLNRECLGQTCPLWQDS